MLCDKCGTREAVVHYAEVLNNQIMKINLCDKCAREKGVGLNEDNLPDILFDILPKTVQVEAGDESLSCPNCAITLSELKKDGRFGCPMCYAAFEKFLDVLLPSMHKLKDYSEKKEEKISKALGYEEQLNVIKKKLEKAIKEEAFEEAAKLRDEIKRLKNIVLKK